MIIQGSKRKVHDILGPTELKPKEEAEGSAVLETIVEELMEALKSGDAKAAAQAFRAACAHCDSESDEQGPNTED